MKKLFSWLRKRVCRHEFRYRDLVLTGILKPAEPVSECDLKGWVKYFGSLDKSDWHLKRVRWPCCKCGAVFYAHCGLDIMRLGKVIGR